MTSTVMIDYPLPEHEQDRAAYEGKFVQFVLDDREYLVFAPFALHRYHNQILAHFLEDNAIDHRWLGPETLEVDVPQFRVIGGGRFRVDAPAATLDLWDNSHVYGRFEENGLSAKIAGAGHAWSGLRVRIR